MKRKNIYTVGQINSYIKNMFSQDYLLQFLQVRGEISNVKYHTSGHIYFTLKDEKGTLACVMFAGSRKGLSFVLKEGQQVVVAGGIDLYERDGKYQLYAKEIELDGFGILYEKYDRLKRTLEEQGMFDATYKQPIPKYIKTLGIVTAPTGAAVQDIIQIAKRRNPYLQILLYPALVQGERAAESIAEGIRVLEQTGVEAIIVGRGGGSIEDLWAFNEELTAQAVFNCKIPIISAVGHETDTTIVDYVADLRAPTPSAAAELAVDDIFLLLDKIADRQMAYMRLMNGKLKTEQARVERLQLKFKLRSPESRIRDRRMYALRVEEQMGERIQQKIREQKQRFLICTERLKGLSPLEKLSQGLAYITDEQGKNVSNARNVKGGDKIKVHVKNGQILAQVVESKIIDR